MNRSKKAKLNNRISVDSGYLTSSNTSLPNIKHKSPSLPDLVYYCPRPLSFPFHNDDHFLPVVEADPRDVARISPHILDRPISIHGQKSAANRSDTSLRRTLHTVRSFFSVQQPVHTVDPRTKPLPPLPGENTSIFSKSSLAKNMWNGFKSLFAFHFNIM